MDLEKTSIERLREGAEISKYYYDKPLMLCYSGGKDSDVILDLAIKSGIEFELQHSHTTADAPETVYHIRRKFKELESKGIKCTKEERKAPTELKAELFRLGVKTSQRELSLTTIMTKREKSLSIVNYKGKRYSMSYVIGQMTM